MAGDHIAPPRGAQSKISGILQISGSRVEKIRNPNIEIRNKPRNPND
jgi:hypothetical protein